MIVIETDAARSVLDALDPDADGSVAEAVDAMTFQRDFYGTHLEDVNRETFRRLLRDPDSVPDHFALDALADGFRDASDRIDQLRERVDALEGVETEEVAADVRRYLPENPDLDATIHGVIDGFNGGFQHGGDVGVSVLQTRPDEFGPKLRHELHHVGAVEVRDDDPFARLTTPTSPDRDVADLVATILLEGLAIAGAQGGLSVYEANPDLQATIEDYRDRETELFDTVDETLRDVATTDDPQARQSLVDSLVTDPDAGLPPTHYVGARMIEAIEAVQDRSTAIDLVTSPERFLPTYQTAAREREVPSFSAKTVNDVSGSVSAVDS